MKKVILELWKLGALKALANITWDLGCGSKTKMTAYNDSVQFIHQLRTECSYGLVLNALQKLESHTQQ